VAEWEYLHFTPTYSSWLNQVELWFAKIERDVIARGVFFTSVPDLNRTLMRYIWDYGKPRKVEILRCLPANRFVNHPVQT
jgi:transposase